MCGIIGYIGENNVIEVLVDGLRKLEYRGYDSAGIAFCKHGGDFHIYKSLGKLKELDKKLNNTSLDGIADGSELKVGIGHTRWATHGKPSENNAHPHISSDICLVHNGIIENYLELKNKVLELGYSLVSETDSEIVAHLLDYHYKQENDLHKALKKSVKELKGSYALVVMLKQNPNEIIIAKNATPIVVGLSEDEVFVASDIPAILNHTRDVVILEDGDIARLSIGSVEIENKDTKVDRPVQKISWDPVSAEKGGYKHFMLKEIYEQSRVISQTIGQRLNLDSSSVQLQSLKDINLDANNINRVVMSACGTAWHACLISKFFIESLAKIPVEVDYGSEYRYRDPIIGDKDLFIAISQSGETADTLSALNIAKDKGAKIISICNVQDSSITRKSDAVLYTYAGPEISVASTKAFTTQIITALILAIQLGQDRKIIDDQLRQAIVTDIANLPIHVRKILELDNKVQEIASKLTKYKDFLFLSRGILYPVALEGALKLKEISYIHAEGYPAGEMKHGPIALVTQETPVIGLVFGDSETRAKVISNLSEVASRGAKLIIVTDYTCDALSKMSNDIIEVGESSQFTAPVLFTIPLQLIAYHVAVNRGTDVDQPRNLAKSVTVE